MADEARKKILALGSHEWLKSMTANFARLEEWQGGASEPRALYSKTLWSMLVAMGIDEITLTAWTGFFDEDLSDGTISVSHPLFTAHP